MCSFERRRALLLASLVLSGLGCAAAGGAGDTHGPPGAGGADLDLGSSADAGPVDPDPPFGGSQRLPVQQGIPWVGGAGGTGMTIDTGGAGGAPSTFAGIGGGGATGGTGGGDEGGAGAGPGGGGDGPGGGAGPGGAEPGGAGSGGVGAGSGAGGAGAGEGGAADAGDAPDAGDAGGCTDDAQCDDGVSCTADLCDPVAHACQHVKQDALCSDGAFCNGIEVCDPELGELLTGCAPGEPIGCGDGIACTLDACDEAKDGCAHAPSDALCDDGMFCNGAESCSAMHGCQPGAPVSCDDGLTCTADACDEAAKSCEHLAKHAACSDGLDCNGAETCDPAAAGPTGCKAGQPIACASDGISCTKDACNEATDACEHAADGTLCGEGEICVPAKGGCVAGKACNGDADCDDDNPCNGVDLCDGVCQSGKPPSCDDGIPCTVDSCTPGAGCVHTANDAFCDDGHGCNGVETCSPNAGCIGGAAPDCDDGVACTFDQCQEPTGTCAHFPQSFLCDDGNACNGKEECTPSGCAPGGAFTCPDDGIPCTTEVCDDTIGTCKSIPHDDMCPCGQTCSVAAGGCGAFCKVATCQGKVYACGDCVDNDGDCKIDSADSQCLGPCDNTESSFYGGIPGQNNSPCKSDCYFDQDTGSGNDECYWSHSCDPLEVPPAYPPEGKQCAYDSEANIPGYSGTCSEAFAAQSQQCGDYCGPLTPNGCDCFGCCAIPGAPTPVWLGSEAPSGVGSCTEATLSDPAKCKPCTQVAACLNECEACELCIGKTELPEQCIEQICPAGAEKCGLPSQPVCPAGKSCITGCCENNPL